MLIKEEYKEKWLDSISHSVINHSINAPIAVLALYELTTKKFYKTNFNTAILDLVSNLNSSDYLNLIEQKGYSNEVYSFIKSDNSNLYCTLQDRFFEYFLALLVLLSQQTYISIGYKRNRFSWFERNETFNACIQLWEKNNGPIKKYFGLFSKCYKISRNGLLFSIYDHIGIINRYIYSFEWLKTDLVNISNLFREDSTNVGEVFQTKLDLLLPGLYFSLKNSFDDHIKIGNLFGYLQGTYTIEETGRNANSSL